MIDTRKQPIGQRPPGPLADQDGLNTSSPYSFDLFDDIQEDKQTKASRLDEHLKVKQQKEEDAD